MLKILPLLVVVSILSFSERVIAQSTATISTQNDPFDPPTYIAHPTGGYWERSGPNTDQRDIVDQSRGVSSQWSDGYGSYYLIGKVGGSCNQLNNGTASWFNETFRASGVLGVYKLSLVKYNFLWNSYSEGLNQNLYYANPIPASHPVNGAPGHL